MIDVLINVFNDLE